MVREHGRMTETSRRTLLLLSLLQARPDRTGPELARRLGVDPRTVRRDVERLRDLGYRVVATRGRDGGYRLDAGAELPPLLFDDEQVVALTVALRTVAASGPGDVIEEAALRALATVRQVLPVRLRHRVDAVDVAPVTAHPGRPAPSVDLDVLLAVSTAVRRREVLRLDYAPPVAAGGAGAETGSADGPGTGPGRAATAPRRVEPHHVVVRDGRWYLLAWDLDRADWRTFRLDRTTPRGPTGPRFAPRELPGDDGLGRRGRGPRARPLPDRAGLVVLGRARRAGRRVRRGRARGGAGRARRGVRDRRRSAGTACDRGRP